jgi:hypothetical protein
LTRVHVTAALLALNPLGLADELVTVCLSR